MTVYMHHPLALVLAALVVALLGALGGLALGSFAGVLLGVGMSLTDHE